MVAGKALVRAQIRESLRRMGFDPGEARPATASGAGRHVQGLGV
jgi:hypothetical protein